MGFRFRRDSKVASGLRINAGKSGVSQSIGRGDARFTYGPHEARTTIGAPEARSAIRSERRYDKAAQKQAACSTPSSTSGSWWPLSRYSHELCADERLGASQRINTQYQAESLIP